MKKDFEYFIRKANRDIQYCEEKGYQELKEYVASLLSRNEELEEENKKLKDANKKLVEDNCEFLQQRIDKAIEYIEQDYDKNQEIIEYCNFEDFYKRLSKILKGE